MFRAAIVLLSLLATPALAAAARSPAKAPHKTATHSKPHLVRPTFNCSKVRSKSHKTICTNDDLARRDRQEDGLLYRARA